MKLNVNAAVAEKKDESTLLIVTRKYHRYCRCHRRSGTLTCYKKEQIIIFCYAEAAQTERRHNTSEHDIQKDSKNDYKLVLYTILINYNQSRRRPPRTPRPGGGTGVKGSYHGVVKSRIRWRKGRIRLERAT